MPRSHWEQRPRKARTVRLPLDQVSEEEVSGEEAFLSEESGPSLGSQGSGRAACDAKPVALEGSDAERLEKVVPTVSGLNRRRSSEGGQRRSAPDSDLVAKKRHSSFDRAEEWVRSEHSELPLGAIIVANAVAIGVEIEAELRFGTHSATVKALYWLQVLFAGIFLAELLLRIRVLGLSQQLTLRGTLDVIVVLLMVVDVWVISLLVHFNVLGSGSAWDSGMGGKMSVLRVLRLLRLVRILRLLKISRQLSLLVVGFARSFLSVLWVFLMLLMVMYIGAVLCVSELGATDNEMLQGAFGNIWSAMYSHFKIMTLEAWPDLCGWAMEQNSLWAAYFIGYIAVTNLVFLNLITGLVMDGVLQGAKSEDWSSEHRVVEAVPFMQHLHSSIAGGRREDCEGGVPTLDQHGFQSLLRMEDSFLQELLTLYRISLRHLDPVDLFEILDTNGNGSLTIMEVAAGLLQLRGSGETGSRVAHPLLVRNDLLKKGAVLTKGLRSCERQLAQHYEREVWQLEQSLCSKVREVRQDLQDCLPVARMPKPVLMELKLPVEDLNVQEVQLAPEAPVAVVPPIDADPEQVESEDAGCEGIALLLRRATTRLRHLEAALLDAKAALATSVAQELALEAALRLQAVSQSTQATGPAEPRGAPAWSRDSLEEASSLLEDCGCRGRELPAGAWPCAICTT